MTPRRSSQSPTVRTTVDLPKDLWRATKIQAVDEQSDLRSVVIAALRAYLGSAEKAHEDAG